MEMYSHAKEVASFWDNLQTPDLEKEFLQSEARFVCEDSTFSDLLSLSSIYVLIVTRYR